MKTALKVAAFAYVGVAAYVFISRVRQVQVATPGIYGQIALNSAVWPIMLFTTPL